MPGNRRRNHSPPRAQVEVLTEQFYAWERRGRGWQVWGQPVELEPPFTPFRFHWVPTPHIDDGVRPTILSSLTDRLINVLKPKSDDDWPELDLEDVEPEVDESAEELAEISIALPQSAEVSPEGAEHFLLSLPRLSRLSFEVIGTPDSVGVQIACPKRERSALDIFLRAHFPQVAVIDAPGNLERSWEATVGTHACVAEYALAEEFMLPLREYRRFASDPLIGIAAALSTIGSGECGVLQVLVRPVRHSWAESIQRAVLDDSGSPFFLDAPEVTRMARDKIARPLYACIVRVAARAGSRERSEQIVRTVGGALTALANPPSNHLVRLPNDEYDDELHEADLLERRTHRSGMILSSAEVVSLVHPPSSSVRIEKLMRALRRTSAAPSSSAAAPYKLGMNEHAGRAVEPGLTPDQRSHHVYIIGASGMGKSTLLSSLMLQDLEAGDGFALFDPHGDLVDEVLRRCPDKRAEDVVLIDPSDAEHPIGFNVLSAHSELERTLLSSDLVAVFRRLSTSWGDQMTSVLGNAILAILESDRGGTLVDLRRFLVEPDFRKEYLRSVRDGEVVYYWQREFPLLAGKPQAPLLTRLDTFLRPKPIRYMVAQKESRLDLRKVMDEGQVLLVRLAHGAIGEENANLLGTLLVSKLHQLAMSRQDVAASDRRPFYLYLDEFHNFVTPSMEGILSGARKYRLGLVLAHQDLQQIRSRSPEVLNSVLTNPYTRICFRVGEQDARSLAEGYAHFDARDLQGLGKGDALVRIESSEQDFNLRTRLLPDAETEMAAGTRNAIVDRSRSEYGRSRSEIEQALHGSGRATEGPASPVGGPSASEIRRRSIPVASVPATPEPNGLLTASRPVTPEPSAGRGGAQHRYLQGLIRQWAEANGWRSSIEEPVLDDAGRVDVLLRKGKRSIACEVAVTTSAAHELQNVRKCLSAGFDHVLAASPTKRLLKDMRKEAANALTDEERRRVEFCAPEEMFVVLDAINSRGRTTEQTVRGYRVKVRVSQDPQRSPESAQQTISTVLAKALRRLRGRPR